MKVKHAIIPFIPITLAMLVLKLMSLFSVDSNGLLFGMTKVNIAYIVIALALLIFLITAVFNLFDKKTAPAYMVKKNPIAGIFAVLCGITVPVFSCYALIGITPDDRYFYIVTILTALLSIPAAIAFLLMAKVHFAGKSASAGVSFLFIFPCIWGCAVLISEFITATKQSVSSSDMTGLFCYVFITLYLFTHSMAVSRIKGKNPVKSAFLYGLPAVALTLTGGVYSVFTAYIEKAQLESYFYGGVLLAFGAYSLSFIIELYFNCLTVNEVELVESLPIADEVEEEEEIISDIGYDDLVFSDSPSIKDLPRNDYSDYISNVESLNDFILGYNSEDDDEPIPYFTKEEMQKSLGANDLFVAADFDANDSLIVHDSLESDKADKEEKKEQPKSSDKDKSETVQNDNDTNAKAEPAPAQEAERPASKSIKKPQPKAAPKSKTKEKPVTAPKNFDELEQILSEARSQRKANDSEAPKNSAPKMDPAQQSVVESYEKNMSDIDMLLQQLDNM